MNRHNHFDSITDMNLILTPLLAVEVLLAIRLFLYILILIVCNIYVFGIGLDQKKNHYVLSFIGKALDCKIGCLCIRYFFFLNIFFFFKGGKLSFININKYGISYLRNVSRGFQNYIIV